MASSTSQHTALTNLAVQLAARPYITTNNVAVASGPYPRGFFGARLTIQLWETEGDPDEWMSLGARSSEEVYTIHGAAEAWAAGANEEAIVAARAAAVALVDEIAAQLRTDPSINSAVRVAGKLQKKIDQWFDDTGRLCQVEFWIRCEQRLSGS